VLFKMLLPNNQLVLARKLASSGRGMGRAAIASYLTPENLATAIQLGRKAISGVRRLRKAKKKPTPRSSMPMSIRSVPAARTYHVESRPARIKSGLKSTVISNHELIATVNGSQEFATMRYSVNPGLLIYTWLSTQAAGWEKYKFKKLNFVYVPAEAVVTTPGSVYLAAEYDPNTAPPSSLQGLSTYETQSNARVFESCSLNIPPYRMFDGVQHKRIRCGNVAGDLQLYDACNFVFSTISCAQEGPIGQIWVHYEVEFFSPQTEPIRIVPPNYTFVNQIQTNPGTIPATGVSTTINYELNPLLTGLGLTKESGPTPNFDVYRLPCGSYRLDGSIALGCTNGTGGASYSFGVFVNGLPTAGSFLVSSTLDPDGIKLIPFHTYIQMVNPGDYFQLKVQIIDPTPAGVYNFDQGGCLTIQTL
jgi:hypothetical protein